MDEREAIARLKSGDISGLEHLVIQHQVQAVRAAYLVCRDHAQSEDIVQSAFIRAYERIGQFDDTRPFAPWFMRSVINDALKATQRQARTIPLDMEEHAYISPVEPEIEERLEALDTGAAINAAVAQLSPEQRAAIVLRYYLDLNDDEMSSRLECANSTVRWRLHAARQRLRDLLPAWVKPGAEPWRGGEAGTITAALYAGEGDTR